MMQKTKAELVEELQLTQAQLSEAVQFITQFETKLSEAMSADDILGQTGWRLMGAPADEATLDAATVKDVAQRARLAALLSPVIVAGLKVLRLFVFGQGFEVTARDADIGAALAAFMGRRGGRRAFWGHRAIMQAVASLHTDGNLFLWLHNVGEGMVETRRLDLLEINDIFCNPDDKDEPWFYLRQTDAGVIAYPDITFTPTAGNGEMRGRRQGTRGAAEAVLRAANAGIISSVEWERPVHHVAVNKRGKWGVCSYLAAINWAKGYEQFLENRLTLYAAYAVLALIVKEQAKRLPGIRTALGGTTGDSPVKGSVATLTPEGGVEALKTRDATTPPSEGIQFLEMVMMVFGFPPHLWGKEEPGGMGERGRHKAFRLAIESERTAWKEDMMALFEYVLLQQVKAGKLRGTIVQDATGEIVQWPDGVDATISITFPPMMDEDVSQAIKDIIAVTTLDGNAPTGHITPADFLRMVGPYLDTESVDQMVKDTAARLGDVWPLNESELDAFIADLKEVSAPPLALSEADLYRVPAAARNNARRVLAWRDEYGDKVKGMTAVGWRRARQLADNETVDYETVAAMSAFNRHRQNYEKARTKKKDDGGNSWEYAGIVAWLGWGGTTGINWARSITGADSED